MKITDSAKTFVEGVLAQYSAEGIRVFFAGMSCGSPKLGLSLDGATEEDTVIMINGIKVAIEDKVLSHSETITLDVQGESLVMLGNTGCC